MFLFKFLFKRLLCVSLLLCSSSLLDAMHVYQDAHGRWRYDGTDGVHRRGAYAPVPVAVVPPVVVPAVVGGGAIVPGAPVAGGVVPLGIAGGVAPAPVQHVWGRLLWSIIRWPLGGYCLKKCIINEIPDFIVALCKSIGGSRSAQHNLGPYGFAVILAGFGTYACLHKEIGWMIARLCRH